jgi:hypothetical protein
MKSLHERFEEFIVRAIPLDAPAIQREAMQIAFFAGVSSMLSASMEIADIQDEAECVRVLDSFHLESAAFASSLKRIH